MAAEEADRRDRVSGTWRRATGHPVQGPRRFNDPIEPMDLANMRQNGVRSLAVSPDRPLVGASAG